MYDFLKARLVQSRHKDVFVASGLAFVVRIVGAFAGFIATIFVARELGAVEAGYYFLAFSIVSILAAVSQLGMDNTLLRFIGANPGQSDSVFRKAMIASGIFSAAMALCLYYFSSHFSVIVFDKPQLVAVLKAMSISVVGVALFTICSSALQGLRKVTQSIFVLNIFINILLVVTLSLGALDAEKLARIFSWLALFNAFLGVLLFLYCRPKLSGFGDEVSWSDMWVSCLPLWFVVIMNQLVQWSGQFVAGVYLDSELVAQVAVAQRTAMLASFVLIAVNLVVAPRFAALHSAGNRDELEKLAQFSVRLIVIMALPIIGVMLFFPDHLMALYGQDFIGGSLYLQILALGQFVSAITGSVGYLLVMSGHEKDMRNITLFSGPASLLLIWGLTIGYGAIGNVIGTSLAIASQKLFAVYYVKKRLGINTLVMWRR